jgi:hypothetical protein
VGLAKRDRQLATQSSHPDRRPACRTADNWKDPAKWRAVRRRRRIGASAHHPGCSQFDQESDPRKRAELGLVTQRTEANQHPMKRAKAVRPT